MRIAAGVALTLLIVALLATRGLPLVALAPLAPLGTWLPAVDLGVQRLPNKIIYPLLGWQAFVVIITSLITGDPSLGWRTVGGALIAFTGFDAFVRPRAPRARRCQTGCALIGLDVSMIRWRPL